MQEVIFTWDIIQNIAKKVKWLCDEGYKCVTLAGDQRYKRDEREDGLSAREDRWDGKSAPWLCQTKSGQEMKYHLQDLDVRKLEITHFDQAISTKIDKNAMIELKKQVFA